MNPKQLTTKWSRLHEDSLKALQAQKFRRYLAQHVLPFSAYYRKLFEENHLRPEDFNTLADLAKIPFTSKADVGNTPENPQRSRDFILIPDPKVLAKRPSTIVRAVFTGKKRVQKALGREYRPIFMTSTTGRSADPVPFLYTGHDLDVLGVAGERMMELTATPPEFRILNMFPYAPHLAFWQVHYAATVSGAFSLSTGGGKVMGTDGNIKMLRKINPDALIGMPTFLYHVLNQAVEEGDVKLDKLSRIVLGGEKAPEGMRRKLRELARQLGASSVDVLATYGFTEAKLAFVECPFPHDGPPSGYHLYPDYGIIEVIDPDTGEVVPDEQPGEIVYTSLDARGSAVIRYRTGDIIEGGITYKPCPHCHRAMPRLMGRISRQSNFMEMNIDKIKGTLVDFNELENLLEDCEGLGSWQIELRKRNDDPLDTDEMIVHVQKSASADADQIENALMELFTQRLEIKPNRVDFHCAKEMQKLHGVGEQLKELKVVDNRPKPDANGKDKDGDKVPAKVSDEVEEKEEEDDS
ncbi:MAG: AMP-binding protein [Verrucomicrobia bacterium]|nr:AMP-binding protein [Verrucomicrobiota bacterium]MCH8512680.1 AMP-binding protein [Kiritimatiellia bacterium]